MVMLPIQFWCGYSAFGRATVHLLALGVIFTGVLKDFLCLPRPLSPPLQRITMSGSAALEYGFPSTHSANAVSVAAYALWLLHDANDMDPTIRLVWQVVCYAYACSIMFGRIYCGMHGFFDVVVGTLIGGLLTLAQVVYEPAYDVWITSPTIWNPMVVLFALLFIVRTHPEPADDCPCFDDSVAFAGVLVGTEVSLWHYARTSFSIDHPAVGTTPYSIEEIGMPKTVLRILLGVLLIFVWRATMKPLLLTVLPPIFRTVERVGIDLPRPFFLKASQYTSVPTLRKDDNVIPSASDIPGFISNVRQRRGRAVSIGPQSAADAYETIAYRNEQRRRGSMTDGGRSLSPPLARLVDMEAINDLRRAVIDPAIAAENSSLRPQLTPISGRTQSSMALPPSDSSAILSPLTPPETDSNFGSSATDQKSEAQEFEQSKKEAENERNEIFLRVERPRVRYDVEVITKLIVYCGIGWLAVEACPVLFECIGLGTGARTVR